MNKCSCKNNCKCKHSDYPHTYKIKKAISENPETKTFELDAKIDAQPGQFLMLWLPGVDEKPYTVANAKPLAVTVQKRGIFSGKVLKLKKGDYLGVRGPYGNSFTTRGVKKACIVAGGVGIATLRSLILELLGKKVKMKVIYGAADREKFVYMKWLKKKLGKNLYLATDNGSAGRKGFATDVLEEILRGEKFGMVYGCGPELMLKKVFEISEKHKTECELSLDRYMKCGFGVCGQCAIDDKLVCVDGTVFNSAQLRRMKEFGAFCRLKSGKKVSVEEYVNYRGKRK